MTSSSRGMLLIAACGAALALACLAVLNPPPRSAVAIPDPSPENEPPGIALSPPPLVARNEEAELSGRAAAEPVAPGSKGERHPAGAAVAPGGGGGRLRIRAIDADTGSPLTSVRVRAASETRIADKASNGTELEVELTLTPDSYSVLVLHKGYEPAETEPVRVAGGEIVRLADVPLRAGSARILGLVTGDVRAEPSGRIELLGEGRRPCAGCPAPSDPSGWTRIEPCPSCGYSNGATSAQLPPGGRFTFERLASGPYAIRLLDDRGQPMGPPKHVVLREAESLPVEIEASWPRAVRVEVLDTDGASLASAWAERVHRMDELATEESVVTFEETGAPAPLEFSCTVRIQGFPLAGSTFDAPPIDATGLSIGMGAFGSRRLGFGAHRAVTVDDRVRSGSDWLRPELPVPEVKPSTFSSSVDSDGLARLEPRPSLAITLDMACGPFAATVDVPASRDTTTVRAAFARRKPAEGASTLRELERGPRR